ncbi:DDE_3 domain-containing protein [Trichonephila clavipes]|nr:DDE_3 domain-containing protein [Trichonephila clavipes]
MSDFGARSSGRRDAVKMSDYLSIIADQLHSYIASVYSTGNGIFQQDSITCQKARNVFERFVEHKDEFQLISRPLNPAGFNLIEPIWVFTHKAAQRLNILPRTCSILAKESCTCFAGRK